MAVTYRKEYKPPAYTVQNVNLNIFLDVEKSTVETTMLICAREATDKDLHLHGEELELEWVEIYGKRLVEGQDYQNTEDGGLVVFRKCLPTTKVQKPFELKLRNTNKPSVNTELSGLYTAGDLLCTQCEAEGFRRITYFVDRPDCMARYTVRLEADRKKYPVLLSNGDCVRIEDLGGDRHAAVFYDPFPKPSYLFALVAGPLAKLSAVFTTLHGAEVDVEIYAEAKYIDRCHYALEQVLKSMKFDEDEYGRVYDLSTYRVVCLENFNAGAMENKSLTTYNIASILASKDTANDRFFERICATIGHEYFHNWSGDRVTIRDWFQITLKEGFTSVREHAFVEHNFSRARTRIDNVRTLRAVQFPEDAGAMAHPIRPDSYECIDNFYTTTVYDKGAEVIRMMRPLLGDDGFRKGCDLYFSTFDGQAVSCAEFIWAMGKANNLDLSQMETWYGQAGTPVIVIERREWDSSAKTYTLRLKQIIPSNALPEGQGKPYIMPVKMNLIGVQSKKPLLEEQVLVLKDEVQTWTFQNVREDSVPSILRDFSAPVKVQQFLTLDELAHLMAYDTDAFVCWDAAQSIYTHFLIDLANQIFEGKTDGADYKIPEPISNGIKEALANKQNDLSFVAQCITLPPAESLAEFMKPAADPIALLKALRVMRRVIAGQFEKEFRTWFDKVQKESQSSEWTVDQISVGRRALQNVFLSYLCLLPPNVTMSELTKEMEAKISLAVDFQKTATCYNDREAGFLVLLRAPADHPDRKAQVQFMYEQCKGDGNLIDQWVYAMIAGAKSISEIKEFLKHPDVKDTTLTNRFRAVVRGIYHNQEIFHANDGSGYMLMAQRLGAQDSINAYITAGSTKLLLNFTSYTTERKQLMKNALKWMSDNCTLSRNTAEVVSRGLAI